MNECFPKEPSLRREMRPTVANDQAGSWHCTSSSSTSFRSLPSPHSMAPSCLHLDSRISRQNWPQHQFQDAVTQKSPLVLWAHRPGLLPPSLLRCRGLVLGVRADNFGMGKNLLPAASHSLQSALGCLWFDVLQWVSVSLSTVTITNSTVSVFQPSLPPLLHFAVTFPPQNRSFCLQSSSS